MQLPFPTTEQERQDNARILFSRLTPTHRKNWLQHYENQIQDPVCPWMVKHYITGRDILKNLMLTLNEL